MYSLWNSESIKQLPKATRWISRTADQDAIALVEAGTCEPEGYLAEKAKGYVKVLPAGETFVAEFEIGALAPDDAKRAVEHVLNLAKV